MSVLRAFGNRLRHFISRPAGLARIALPDGAIDMMRCDGRDQVLEQALREGWDAFERPLPEVFRAAVRRSPGVVTDVGANTGFYSLLAARCGREVLAFEPYPVVCAVLRQNIAANNLQHSVAVFPWALSDQQGTATLYLPDPGHGQIETSASLDADFKPHASTLDVQLRTLDNVLIGGSRSKIGVIKIDAEGHEAAVLRGAERTIERDRPVLFVEVLPRAEMDALSSLLQRLDYVDVALRPHEPHVQATTVRFVPDAWNHAFVPREIGLDWLSGG